LSFILLNFHLFGFLVFGFGMAALAVNGTGTYGKLRKMFFYLSLHSVVIGPFNAEATRTECWQGCFSPFLHSVVLPPKVGPLCF
jgi:hypothetical protein